MVVQPPHHPSPEPFIFPGDKSVPVASSSLPPVAPSYFVFTKSTALGISYEWVILCLSFVSGLLHLFFGRTDAEAETPVLWPPHVKSWLIGKDSNAGSHWKIPPMLGGIGGKRRRGWQRMRWLDGITDSMDVSLGELSGSWWWTGRPGVLQFIGSQRVRHGWVTDLIWFPTWHLALTLFSSLCFS